jgi:prolyl-tRNA synthetase
VRSSHLIFQTRREVPSDAISISHQLLLKAGFIRPMGPGMNAVLPLAWRTLQNIEKIMKSELEAPGGLEIQLPFIQAIEARDPYRWQITGSHESVFKDQGDHELLLAESYEASVIGLARNEIRSYRQLPALLFQFQTHWRDEARTNDGLARAREFRSVDCFGFSADDANLDMQYQALIRVFQNIFSRCSLPVNVIEAIPGRVDGKKAVEFFYLTPSGNDSCLFCDSCGYAASLDAAISYKPMPDQQAILPMEAVATPNTTSIKSLAEYLHISDAQTAKAVFLIASIPTSNRKVEEKFIFTVVRGDMEVNESLLASQIGAISLRPANEDEIRTTGAVPGYASPVGLKDVYVVVDDLIPGCSNLVAGANKEGYHLLNVNFGRDYQAQKIANIVYAHEGDLCPKCKSPLHSATGIKVGKLLQDGLQPDLTFLAASGQTQNLQICSGSIGVGRLLACVVEEHHDEWGICFPKSIAPYPIQIVLLKDKVGEVETLAAKLEKDLSTAGLEPLIDDRPESAGVKFMDTDLIGIPLRITISERALQQGGVELKCRNNTERRIVPLDRIMSEIKIELDSLSQ